MRLAGAGVLPFCISPDGQLFFVLGREHDDPHWRGGGKWSAFQGRSHTDESAEHAAIREFAEESLGVVDVDPPLPTQLDTGAFAMRVQMVSDARGGSAHVTYVTRCRYDPDVARRFHETRTLLAEAADLTVAMQSAAARMPRRPPYYTEGDAWNGDRGDRGDRGDGWCVTSVKREGDGVRIRCGAWERVIDVVPPDPAYRDWLDHRERLEAVLARAPHEAVRTCRRFGQLQWAHVDRSYLEKSTIALWPFAELKAIARDDRVLERWFRPFFGALLREVVRAFSVGGEVDGRGQ
jgi:hypothetical protein